MPESTLRDLLPLLVPVILIQLALMVAALLDLRKRPATRGPKWMWVAIIILVNLIGPIAYFVIGRPED
ncbi:MAG: PLD nuclease N-terminal domain-containing protein [Chloroflexota bacterium]